MKRTTVVNLKGHRDDPEYADVIYVGRAMNRGGWHLKASPLASPFRPGPDGVPRGGPGEVPRLSAGAP
ncbi:hypothetical protein HOK021_36640 [Streptomyces hygroscopicus]|nr:hypothetical protein HOK021_36640 [Streptomyces hygroscopicus]